MSSVISPRHVVFARGLYPLGLALTLFPLVDIGSRLVPPNFGNLQWRFAAFGLALSSLSVLLLGLAVIGLTAALRGHAVVLRALAVAAWLAAGIAAVVLALFLLDAAQAQGLLREPGMRPALYKTVATTAVAGVLSAVALVGIGLAAWRAGAAPPLSAPRPDAARDPRLVFPAREPAGRS